MKLNKSKKGIRYLVPGSVILTHQEIWEEMRRAPLEITEANPEVLFLSLLETVESKKVRAKLNYHLQGDKHLANRIIREGGFFNYIRRLENEKTMELD